MPVSQTSSVDRIVVALPVKDEERRIQAALRSLDIAARRVVIPVSVVLLLNNCTDRTRARVNAIARLLSVPLHVLETALPAPLANAGGARRLCLEVAADLAPGGLLMTTDADAVVSRDWFRAALSAMSEADLICGTISIRGAVAGNGPSNRIERIEKRYAAALHEVRFAVDRLCGRQGGAVRPHYVESGAALALRARVLDDIGGLPPVPSSEDRALVHRVESHGMRVRYCAAMRSRVSGRLDGRAEGGMAACMRARRLMRDPLADQAMLAPAQVAELWERAHGGQAVLWPDRSVPHGAVLRASDLEAMLPDLVAIAARTQSRAGATDAA